MPCAAALCRPVMPCAARPRQTTMSAARLGSRSLPADRLPRRLPCRQPTRPVSAHTTGSGTPRSRSLYRGGRARARHRRRFGSTCEDGLPGLHVELDDVMGMRLRRRTKLQWKSDPSTVLIVKKWQDAQATAKMREIASWLVSQGLRVLVEPEVNRNEMPEYDAVNPHSKLDSEPPRPDLAITLGGDGTLLHLSTLFGGDISLAEGGGSSDAEGASSHALKVPPVVSFGLGTLGFMTPFSAEDYRGVLGNVLLHRMGDQPLYCTLRTRLVCQVLSSSGAVTSGGHVMNECVIHNSDSPTSLCRLHTSVDHHRVTTVHGDGLIVSTPSGSTAYNLSAGGSLVAPSVPCILITPIAPHSLSSRPFIVSEASTIEIQVPFGAKHDARATLDGRTVVPVPRGSTVRLTRSAYPIPIINLWRHDEDWFRSLSSKLGWSGNPFKIQ